MDFLDLPPIDAHAHIATDVTPDQVRRLGRCIVFAVTRDLAEAQRVPRGRYPRLIWGLGVHPGNVRALDNYDGQVFEALLKEFPLVGEVGLDRRSSRFALQMKVLVDVLSRIATSPVLASIHSVGATTEIVSLLASHRLSAPILHWFNGNVSEVVQAAENGAWFSVNASMRTETLVAMPRNRIITETDFPYTRKSGSVMPGSVQPIEEKLAQVWQCPLAKVRLQVWSNFVSLLRSSGTLERMPDEVRCLSDRFR